MTEAVDDDFRAPAEDAPTGHVIREASARAKRGAYRKTAVLFAICAAVGAGAIFGISSVMSSPNTTASSVPPPATNAQPGGYENNMSPAAVASLKGYDKKKADEADGTGASHLPPPTMAGEPTKPTPSPTPTAQPIQVGNNAPADRAQGSTNANHEQALGQPVRKTISTDDPTYKAVHAALMTALAKGANYRGDLPHTSGGNSETGRAGAIPVNYRAGAGTGTADDDAGNNRTPTNARTGQDYRRSKGTLVAPAHRADAFTRIGLNSDVESTCKLEILSGPLKGAFVYGKPNFKGKNAGITLDRMEYQDRSYKIEAIVLTIEDNSPALDVDVENHYGDRLLLPGVASFFGAMGKAASMPAVSSTVTAGNTTITASSPSSLHQDVMAGVGGFGTATSNVLTQDAAQIRPTVKLAANTEQAVEFLREVWTGDAEDNVGDSR